MQPTLALLLWLVLLIALLRFDPAREGRTSYALWVPLIWLAILGSRLPSQWQSAGVVGTMSLQAMGEGNPLDRTIFLLLIVIAIGILFSRRFSVIQFAAKNILLISFLSFALLSVFWSDFPFVVFKRWFRDFGTYLVILVVLTDRSPLEAMRTVLRRLAYLLVPLSIVLDKYFVELSRVYNPWTGVATYVGATTSKNMLGLLCLVSGLYFLWDIFARWPHRRQRRTKLILAVDVTFLAMSILLLQTAQSTTSKLCLVLGGMVILASKSKFIRRRPAILKAAIPGSFCLYLILVFVFELNGAMAQALGKDPTLTDRTEIWAFLLGMHTNPLIGTGYQSFWVGPRLDYFWHTSGLGFINEAHNGFIELYLELGIIGVVLFIGFLIASYRIIYKRFVSSPGTGILGLAVWLVLVFYNMSEAAFEWGLMYALFLMTAMSVPERSALRVSASHANKKHGAIPVGQEMVSHGTAGLSTGPKKALPAF